MPNELKFFAVERQVDLAPQLRSWLSSIDGDPLAPAWIVVSSAAMRQRLDWDLALAGQGDAAVSSNFRYFFLEEFVRTVEELVLHDQGFVRHDWRPESIATRLVSLASEEVPWDDAMAEASFIDEMLRWRRDSFDIPSEGRLSSPLVSSEEWRAHGPFTQRDVVLDGLRSGKGRIAPVIAFYGLDNAPGGSDFVTLVRAVAARSTVGIFSVYPDSTRADEISSEAGVTWWRSLDEHVSMWRESGVPIHAVAGAPRSGDLQLLQAALGSGITTRLSSDGSVKLLGAVGPARQAEMIRDEIIRLLERSGAESVPPHRILITSPQLSRFVPHIERHWDYPNVLHRTDDQLVLERLPRVPYELTERDASSFRNRARLLGALLGLIGNYVTITQIEELLQFDSMTEALNLAESDIARLGVLAREGRLNFGITPHQRAHLEVFTSDSEFGTWQRFSDRLATTAMMPDNSNDAEQLGTGSDLLLIGNIFGALRTLQDAQMVLIGDERRSMMEWWEWCGRFFGPLIARRGGSDDSLERLVERMGTDFAAVEQVTHVSFEFFRDYWNSLVTGGTRAQTFGRFGVHVAPLPALASSDYDYVFIMGLDEENLPSASLTSPALQPPRIGDPNPRQAVLASLLLCINAARCGVVISYNARNDINGEPSKKSIVLEELCELFTGDAIILEGGRHGFVVPEDREVTGSTYDPRYRGLGEAIVSARDRPPLIKARLQKMSGATSSARTPTLITVKEMHQFLRNSAGHFVTRGLLGADLERVNSDDKVPRIAINGLDAYSIRNEIFQFYYENPNDGVASGKLYEEIASRENLAGDIPFALLANSVDSANLEIAGRLYREDMSCYDALGDAEAESFYAPIALSNGIVIEPRTTNPDENNPWTVRRDYSSRYGKLPGAPATVRFYAGKMDSVSERREMLQMLIDLVIMKINQPPREESTPVATLFFPRNGKKGGNPQVSYCYVGTRAEALATLERFVYFYNLGLTRPLAIGRHTTPMNFERQDTYDAYNKDVKEPLMALIFGNEFTDFVDIAKDQGITAFLETLRPLFVKCRETSTQRILGRQVEQDRKISVYTNIDRSALRGDA